MKSILLVFLGFVLGFVFMVFLLYGMDKQREAAEAREPIPQRCRCGCEQTGQCKCPNCSVGCGFVVPIP
jgi:hypothetical protein